MEYVECCPNKDYFARASAINHYLKGRGYVVLYSCLKCAHVRGFDLSLIHPSRKIGTLYCHQCRLFDDNYNIKIIFDQNFTFHYHATDKFSHTLDTSKVLFWNKISIFGPDNQFIITKSFNDQRQVLQYLGL